MVQTWAFPGSQLLGDLLSPLTDQQHALYRTLIQSRVLAQTKRLFARAFVVGSRFPICLVHHGGMVLEVSSFHTNTPAQHVPIDAAWIRRSLFEKPRRGRRMVRILSLHILLGC